MKIINIELGRQTVSVEATQDVIYLNVGPRATAAMKVADAKRLGDAMHLAIDYLERNRRIARTGINIEDEDARAGQSEPAPEDTIKIVSEIKEPGDTNVERNEGFTQVCVWHSTIVGEEKIDDFVEWLGTEFGIRAQYLEEIQTTPDMAHGHPVDGTGGRNDVFFAVHQEDVAKFAVPRLKYGIRWLSDAIAFVKDAQLYPDRVRGYLE